jgi:hypothetical protein
MWFSFNSNLFYYGLFCFILFLVPISPRGSDIETGGESQTQRLTQSKQCRKWFSVGLEETGKLVETFERALAAMPAQ